jgi:hypothetical protein
MRNEVSLKFMEQRNILHEISKLMAKWIAQKLPYATRY